MQNKTIYKNPVYYPADCFALIIYRPAMMHSKTELTGKLTDKKIQALSPQTLRAHEDRKVPAEREPDPGLM